jgi:hypothetical protein
MSTIFQRYCRIHDQSLGTAWAISLKIIVRRDLAHQYQGPDVRTLYAASCSPVLATWNGCAHLT